VLVVVVFVLFFVPVFFSRFFASCCVFFCLFSCLVRSPFRVGGLSCFFFVDFCFFLLFVCFLLCGCVWFVVFLACWSWLLVGLLLFCFASSSVWFVLCFWFFVWVFFLVFLLVFFCLGPVGGVGVFCLLVVVGWGLDFRVCFKPGYDFCCLSFFFVFVFFLCFGFFFRKVASFLFLFVFLAYICGGVVWLFSGHFW